MLWKIQSLIARVERRVLGGPNDYRAILFDDLVGRLDGRRPPRILEIGPRDGEDTRRLVTLEADKIILVELSNQRDRLDQWLPSLDRHPIELIDGNIMYDAAFDRMEPSDDDARDYHLSVNITHLPSLKAVETWLHMIGFTEIELSACHRKVNRMLGKTRAAFIARRPEDATPDVYYHEPGHDFPIGRAR